MTTVTSNMLRNPMDRYIPMKEFLSTSEWEFIKNLHESIFDLEQKGKMDEAEELKKEAQRRGYYL